MTALAICGWKNSGKTTLIEALLPRLQARGLRLAVLKHDAHGLEVDHPGTDSERFFRAGADVMVQGPGETLWRRHPLVQPELQEAIDFFTPRCDLILVEGHKTTPLAKIWLQNKEAAPPPADLEQVLLELPLNETRVDRLLPLIHDRLEADLQQTPVFACLLLGGRSQRMGAPKHLTEDRGSTWIETLAARLGAKTHQVVLAGAGEVPASLASLTRLADAPDARGPLSGLLAALRWNPRAAWLLCACDMPALSGEAVDWLLSQRQPGVHAVLPRLPGKDTQMVEPLLAYYDFRAAPLVEHLARAGRMKLQALAREPGVISPETPGPLQDAWKNINTLEELEQYRLK